MKRLKKLIRLSFCLILIIILIFTLSFSAFASPPSIFPDDYHKPGYYLFAPFNVKVLGNVDVYSNTEIVSKPYNFTIPDVFFYSEDSYYSSYYCESFYRFDDVPDSVGFTLFSSPVNSYIGSSGFSSWSNARFTLAITNTADSSLSSSNNVLFQDCYLDPEISLPNSQIGHSGISFMSFDPNYVFPEGSNSDFLSSVLDGLVYGEFYIPGHPRSFVTSFEGGYLSYYKALVYSTNIDWTLFSGSFEDDFTSEELYAAIEEFKTYDFLRLTSDQLEELDYYFGWVGPLYGNFRLTLSFDTTGSGTAERSFGFEYALVDRDLLENFYQFNVDRSTYAGLAGFDRVTRFLGTATSGFLSFEIAPNFTFAGIFLVIISFSLVMWWLKVFAGG